MYRTTYNTLRDTFAVKVSKEINVVEILRHSMTSFDQEVRLIKHTLEEKGPIDARTLSGIWLRDWSPVRSSVSDHGKKEKERSQGQDLLSTSSL